MKLYHGTSKGRRKRIKRKGFKRYTWFTTSKKEARKYADSGYRQGRFDPHDIKGDVWTMNVTKRELNKLAWRLSKTYYKFHHKPPRKEKLTR